jgi:streptogramin lyase
MESRSMLSVNIATFPLRGYGTYPQGIATGAGTDTNVWFTLGSNGGNIGTINPNNPGAGVKQYAIPTYNSGPGPIAAGPDGNYWFFEESADRFGIINPANGHITEIPLLTTVNPQVEGITAGPNGTIWFTEFNTDQVGMINTANDKITEFPVITPGAEPYGIVQGPDGNIWFTEAGANRVGMINPTTHVVRELPIDSLGTDQAEGIAVGPDQNLWFTLTGADKIGVMNPATGKMVAEYPVTTANAKPNAITLGPSKQAMWFTESGANQIAMISTTGTVSPVGAYGSGSTPIGLASGSDGGIWYVESNHIGIEEYKSNASTSYAYAVTKTGGPMYGIAAGANGDLYFTQETVNQVGVFNPATDISLEEAVPTSNSGPVGIALGSDDNLWFDEFGYNAAGDKIGTINSGTGQITEKNVLTAAAQPYHITYDPVDGSLWFTEWAADKVGRINPTTKAVSEYPIPTPKAYPEMITVDASGNVWFTEPSVKQIAELSPSNPSAIHEYPVLGFGDGIVAGPDGNIWFSERVNSVPEIDVFSPSSHTIIARYTGVGAADMTVGPDHNIWFTDGGIGMITTAGAMTQYPVPNAGTEAITSAPDGNLWFTASGTPDVIGVVTLAASSIPTQLAVTTQPPGVVTSGKGFGLVISVENAAGDPDPDYSGSVTIALASNPGGDTLQGTLTATVSHGVAIFPGLTLQDAGMGYTIQATATGLNSVTTDPFNVTLAATALQITTQPPAYVGAGTSFGLTVSAVDGQGNVDTTYNGPITLALGTHPAGSALGVVEGATNGVATFTGLSLSVLGDYTIMASSGNLTSARTAGFVVTGPATQLVIAPGGEPPSSVIAGGSFSVGVVAEDQDGNPAADFNGSVTLALVNGGSVSLQGNVTANAESGQITFTGLSIDTVGDYQIQATSGSLTTGGTGGVSVTVNPAGAAYLVVTISLTSPDVAGTSGTVTVAAYDQYNNLASSGPDQYLGTVDLSSTDKQVSALPPSYTLTAGDGGSHTFTGVALKTAGNQTVSATDSVTSSITGTSAAVDVVSASASQALITSGPLTLVAGSGGAVTVQLEDTYGNLGATSTSDQSIGLVTTSTAGAFYAGPSGGTAITSITIPAGQSTATFSYTDTKEGRPTITASDAALGSAPTQQERINPAAASQMLITNPPLTLTADSRGPITVQFEDSYGNLGAAPATDQTISLGTTGSAGAFYDSTGNAIIGVTIPAGPSSATVYYSDTQAGTPTVTASDIAFSSSVNQVETVYPAAADHFVVTSSFASPDVAGTTGTVTVTAKDHFGNTAGSGPDQYDGTVDLSSTDGQITGLPVAYMFTGADAGSHTFAEVVLQTAGDQTITATDSGNSTHSGNSTVAVKAATDTQLVFTTPPPNPMTAGQAFTVVVSVEDPYGNVDTSYNGTMTITLPGQAGSTVTVTAQNGVAAFTGLMVDATAQGGSIQVSEGGPNTPAGGGLAKSTPPITVNPPHPPPPSPPTITGEQVMFHRKTNKKGKPVGKALLQGFALDFSTAMNAQAAGSAANYTVTVASTKHIKKKKVIVFTPVAFTSSYNAATQSVTLNLAGKQTFAKGGQITVIYSPPNGVSSASGVALDSNDATFTVQPRAKGITAG